MLQLVIACLLGLGCVRLAAHHHGEWDGDNLTDKEVSDINQGQQFHRLSDVEVVDLRFVELGPSLRTQIQYLEATGKGQFLL